MKIRTAVITPGRSEMNEVAAALAKTDLADLEPGFCCSESRDEIDIYLRTSMPDVLLLSTTDAARMEAAIKRANEILPGVAVMLADWRQDSKTLSRAMTLGVRECVTTPINNEELREALVRSAARRRAAAQRPSNTPLYSFFPAKPGVGATTLAVQTALNLASESLAAKSNHKVLLIDTDLQAGMMQFLLKLQTPHGLIDALERCHDLDEDLWRKLVWPLANLDVLQGGDNGLDYKIDLAGLQSITTFARHNYAVVTVDLPSAINALTIHIMQQSQRIFLVTAPDVASLHMAKVRWRQLQDLHLTSQTSLVLNRQEKRDAITLAEIKDIVGTTVYASFASDYDSVQNALLSGSRINTDRTLGKQVLAFTQSLRGPGAESQQQTKRRFLDMFAIPKTRLA